MNDSLQLLNLSPSQIRSAGAHWTAREIAQQPQLWSQIARLVGGDAALGAFLTPLLADPALRVVVTGAGSSSFIGRCLAASLSRMRRRPTEAIATTDIVASPSSTLAPDEPTLMVHCARSGNSPESVAAMELAEQRIERCAHLIVTCNTRGDLNRRGAAMRRAHAVILPEACNDQSFAMTSSFTGMLLAAGVALRVLPADGARFERLAQLGTQVMTACCPLLESLVRAKFERVVYLGSGELKGLAFEAALKMLELSDGRVVSVGETPLGFRHGPKTIVNGSTLVVVFLSNDSYTGQYDLDLFKELQRDAVAGRVIALAGRADLPKLRDLVVLGANEASLGVMSADALLTDLELCLPYVVFAQTLALLRSLSLGLSPDSPNAAGTVSRVVQGVSIYPFGDSR